MMAGSAAMTFKGKRTEELSSVIEGRTVVTRGRWIKTASIQDEEWLEAEPVTDPEAFLSKLRESPERPDIFQFGQKVYETKPKHPYFVEWDNVAAISVISFEDWWDRRVSRKLRQDVNRAKRLGVTIAEAEWNEDLIQGIHDIYNETPIRQGRKFWHFGKGLDAIRRENSTYLDRSVFVGAYHEGELIGFLKIVFVERVGRLMQILAKLEHNDKRPLNLLIAKAVEICAERNCLYFVYGKFTYDGKKESSIVDFKRRNGFQEIRFPRYYIPLTWKGKVWTRLRLHRGLKRWAPQTLLRWALAGRARALEWKAARKQAGKGAVQNVRTEPERA